MSRSCDQHLLKDARPEIELLLACARTRVDADQAGRIQSLLRKDLDWAFLVSTACRHGLVPLLYRNLRTTGAGSVPHDVTERLQALSFTIACLNARRTEELLRLLKIFETHGIPAIPLKGPALAESVYGDVSLRRFADLDILLHKHHALRARELLVSEGYRPLDCLTDAEAGKFLATEGAHHFSLVRDGTALVELHWRLDHLLYRPDKSSDRLWERLVPVRLAGETVHGFQAEDLLYMLCQHGACHHWEHLSWICDVAELVRGPRGIDWRRVLEEARTSGTERILLLGLFLARDLVGAPLPDEVSRRAQADPKVRALAAKVYQWILREPHGQPGLVERVLFGLNIRERLSDRIRICRLWLTPCELDRDVVPLPAPLCFLHCLVRPIRLLWKYELGPLRRFLGASDEKPPGRRTG
jgi:hypothetical protein